MKAWVTNVRFPEEFKTELEGLLTWVNEERPQQIGEVSKNDLIVYAVQKVIADLKNERAQAQAPHNVPVPM